MEELAKLVLKIENARHENIPEDTVPGRPKMKEFNKLFAQTDL